MELNEITHNKIISLCESGDEYLETDLKKSIEFYRKAISLLPEPKEMWDAYYWILVALGDAYYFQKDYRLANECFSMSLNNKDYVKNPYVNKRIGEVLFETNELETAFAYLNKAYSIDKEVFDESDNKYLNWLENELNNGWMEKVNELMDESSKAYDLKEYDNSIKNLIEAWDILPGDKYQHKESYHIIQRILSTAIISKNHETMMQYLPHIFKASPNRLDYGGREFWAGKVYYEIGNKEESYKYFKIAYKKSKKRCFNFEDDKYLLFFREYELRE